MEYSGLTKDEVKERLNKGEVNTFTSLRTRSKKDIILHNTFTYFNFVNAFLFALVCLTKSFHNGAFFLTIIFNDCICIFEELKAKKILDKMSILTIEEVEVIRDLKWQKIKADKLVLDDIFRLESGMQVPADSTILEGYLEIDESILTGEADTVIKKEADEILAGTIITSGSAVCKVEHVGQNNFSESIMSDAKKYKPAKSLLNAEINRLMKLISIVIIPVGIILFYSQMNSNLSRSEAILKTVSAIVGMIPEGLVVLISIALSISTIRLSRKKVLVQDLNGIEALARVDTLCIDKTGTITTGNMNVLEVIPINTNIAEINEVMGVYIHAFQNGNATSNAIKKYFKEIDNADITNTIPFSSSRKYAAIEINHSNSYYIGAYSFLFTNQDEIYQQIQKYALEGKRAIVVASKEGPLEDSINHLKCIGIILMEDELRPNIQNIISYFKENQVDIKIISGDQAETVSFLARLAKVSDSDKCVDLSTNNISYDELVEENTVFGRVLPKQKKELIEALQRKGHVVAMIGDGVNDVPSLKEADVSLSLEDATYAAKNIANIVLLSNDFGMIPSIVNEGRRVINNISRGATMFLVKTGFSLFISIYVILFHEHYPFIPIHLTVIGMFAVAIPTFLLQFEPCFDKVNHSFLKKALSLSIPSSLSISFYTIICNALCDLFLLKTGEAYTIVVLITFLVYSYTLKKVYTPLNKYRFSIIITMIIAMVCSVFFLQKLFQLNITIRRLMITGILGLFIPLVVEMFYKIVHIFIKLD